MTVDFESLLKVRGGQRARDLLVRSLSNGGRRLPSYWYRGTPNFGDAIARPILSWITGTDPIWVSRQYAGKVLSTGSVLHTVEPGDTIWGTGSIEDRVYELPPNATVLAVRGPLTRSRIRGDVPEVFGDPALLLPEIYDPTNTKRYRVGIVPHYVDAHLVSIDDPGIAVVDVGLPWQDVVDTITSCEVVLSSSLHGLIVAEAYGIPASWVSISGRLKGGEFKFHDYYLATGRAERPPSEWQDGIDRAIRYVAPRPEFDAEPLRDAGSKVMASWIDKD